jgi:WD40 repeat protein
MYIEMPGCERPHSSASSLTRSFVREREIFLEALEVHSETARAAFIERATAESPDLRAAVEELLANHKQDEFMEVAPARIGSLSPGFESSKPDFNDEQIGRSIGRYKLLQKIGEGGCGSVYLAEQVEPLKRRVALKVIKLGMDTRSVVARFEAERQALALMDHPNIARVLDGGATDSGRPYFVMEFVHGARITEYCSEHSLNLIERIQLFIQLCHAIQHAHQKGIIHRDIKPSNVLVAVQDGRAMPKVIDFGVAKAIEEPLTDKTVLTNFHAFIGTPAYSSPEQAQMSGQDVDTRTDVYSLGVLLYELIAQVPPFDPKDLARAGFDEMRRIIRDRVPERPSAQAARLGRTGTPGSGGKTFAIDSDLDWIVMKCLEKERSRRYQTAQDLGSDLQRYLDDEPVSARPPGRGYVLRKALWRHRALVTGMAAVFIALVIGAVLSAWQAVRATRAERAAEAGRLREVALRRNAEEERERAIQSQRQARINEYIADINLADQAVNAGNLSRARDLLRKHAVSGAEDLRGFEWGCLWSLTEGGERTVIAREPSSILALAASRLGDIIAVGLRDSVALYSFPGGKPVRTIQHSGLSLAFSPSGLLATAGRNSVHVWRVSDGADLLRVTGISGPVAFARGGDWLIANSRSGIRIVNSADGHEIANLPRSSAPMAVDPEHDLLATRTREGIALWSLESPGAPKLLRVLEGSAGLLNGGWTREKPVLQFSPDGSEIAAAGNQAESGFALAAWNVRDGGRMRRIPSEHESSGHTGVISGIAFGTDGTLATASWDHSLRLWNLADRSCIRTFLGSVSEVWAVAIPPGSKMVVSGAKDGTVAAWPVSSGASSERDILPGDWVPLAFSVDARKLAAIKDGRELAVLNVQSRAIERSVALDETGQGAAMFSPNPFRRFEISRDFRVLIESFGGGVRVRHLDSSNVTVLPQPSRTPGLTALSPDGELLAASAGNHELALWDINDLKKPLQEMRGDRALFSGDGRLLLTIAGREVAVWDTRTKRHLRDFSTDFPPGFSAALSTDGRILAAGSDPNEVENAIYLFDTSTGKRIGICSGHTQGVGPLAFAPDGKTLASTSTDGTLRFWNVLTQQQLVAVEKAGASFFGLIFAPDQSCLVCKVPGEQGGLRFIPGLRASSRTRD